MVCQQHFMSKEQIKTEFIDYLNQRGSRLYIVEDLAATIQVACEYCENLFCLTFVEKPLETGGTCWVFDESSSCIAHSQL